MSGIQKDQWEVVQEVRPGSLLPNAPRSGSALISEVVSGFQLNFVESTLLNRANKDYRQIIFGNSIFISVTFLILFWEKTQLSL